jgi:hypothetical protein
VIGRPEWAANTDLYQLLKEAVFAMARGKGGYFERLDPVAYRLMEVSLENYPADLIGNAARIFDLLAPAALSAEPELPDLGPTERNDLTGNLIMLFEAMVGDRALLSRYAEKS